MGAVVFLASLPASAVDFHALPVRRASGAAVWSISQVAIDTFLSTGKVVDRGLQDELNASGWTEEEVRVGLQKTYNVSLLGIARFLYSDAGIKFLENATQSYFPYWTTDIHSVRALRGAIIEDAADGVISPVTIMRALPTDFRLVDSCNTYSSSQNLCTESHCVVGTSQCISLLSWYLFLPASLQANQVAPAAAPPRRALPAPVYRSAPVRGLW
jgi:hypothetical protein